MWQISKRRLALWSGLVLALLSAGPPAVRAQPLDPVEDLRQALPMRLGDLIAPTPEVLKFRQDTLKKKGAALKSIPHLRRALALEEWKDTTDHDINPGLREIDASLRKEIGDRLKKKLEEVAASGDPHSRLAVANLIAEMGPSVRGLNRDEPWGFARGLLDVVIQLTRDKDLAVRQEALRALGNINPPPDKAADVFQKALKSEALGPRRLAADGLAQLVRVVNHLQKPGRTASGVEATPKQVIDTAQEVVQASLAGMNDEDAQVRALCLIAFQTAALALSEQIPDSFSRKEFPPDGRERSDEEKLYIVKRQELVRREIDELKTGLQALQSHAPHLVKHLYDLQPLVRRSAVNALESTANVRLRMRRRMRGVPSLTAEKGELDKEIKDSLRKYDPLAHVLEKDLPSIGRLLGDSDTSLRRAALEFLELLEEDAAPLQPEITAALSDPNRFVRWGAARILGLIPPEKAAPAVPHLARLLSDFDLNVRLAAAQTLEGMGPLAKDAAPALARAAADGDAEARISAMFVLQRLGPEVAPIALPPLIEGLNHPDPRVRRAIADTLGRFGPAARAALPALRRALGDEDSEVRVNASDAILNITGP